MKVTINYRKPYGTRYQLYDVIHHEAHTLISGSTGCGKSVFLNNFVDDLLLYSPDEVQMIWIDPKRVELSAYKHLPHTITYASEDTDIIDALVYAVDIMEQRYKEMEQRCIRKWDGSHIYIVIDELADMMVSVDCSKEFKRLLQKISQLGRASAIHIVACTQSPSRTTLPAAFMLNITCRVALKCDSKIESKQIIGQYGAESLPRHGECILKNADGVFRANVLMTDYTDLNRLICFWADVKNRAYYEDEIRSNPMKYRFLDNAVFMAN